MPINRKTYNRDRLPATLFAILVTLAFPSLALAGFSGGGGSVTSASMVDPYVPVDGTMNVTGDFAGSGLVSAGTEVDVGTTRVGQAAWSNHSAYAVSLPLELGGQPANGSGLPAVRFQSWNNLATAGDLIATFENARSGGSGTVKAQVDYLGGMVLSSSMNVMASTGIANGTSAFNVNQAGAALFGGAISGAKTITWVGNGSYVIDFGAFAGGGASQNSAQALTGVAFGDACTVGVSADTSAEYAVAGVQVTSAGNIKITIVPLTAAGTVNPASHTYSVVCIRSV